MKIASWNVNGIRACFSKGLKDFVKKEKPDILCLQETKAHPDQVHEDIKKLGSYKYQHWSPCGVKKGYSGTVTFSQVPVLNVSYGIGIRKFDWEGRMVISEHPTFHLLNIYFPNGALTLQRHLFKQEFLKRLFLFLKNQKKKSRKPCIVVGDYNIAHLNIDVFSPKTLTETSGFLPEERKWFSQFLKEGYIDVFRYFYPQKKESYTWWSLQQNARKSNRGWRIDHVCVQEKLKNNLKGVKIHQDQFGSDHCPIVVEFKKA